jgi:hypothetical protein
VAGKKPATNRRLYGIQDSPALHDHGIDRAFQANRLSFRVFGGNLMEILTALLHFHRTL